MIYDDIKHIIKQFAYVEHIEFEVALYLECFNN